MIADEISIQPIIKKSFLFIVEEKSDEELKQLIMSSSAAKTFIRRNESVYEVSLAGDKKTLHYQHCTPIHGEESFEDIMTFVSDNHCLVMMDGDNNVTGFVEPSDICHHLFRKYQHLHAYIDTILHTTEESCTVIDKNQHVIGWTKGAEKLFSMEREQVIQKPITDFFNPEHLEILNTLEKGTSVYHRQHIARENQVVLINSNPVYFQDEIIGAVVSETDITSQIKLNNELYNAREKLFHLEKEVTKLTASSDPFQRIRGRSPAMKKTINKIKKASSTQTGLLIQGESGVGKELFAKAAHHLREDKDAPFVAINCGAIPHSLFESEIFGYERGAFSGADSKGKKGKAALAKGGTLFLDEIGEMPLDMQVKILRLLQEKKFYPVGGTKELEVDFRVIAATNRDLKKMVAENAFRDDLYYRLNVVSIDIPPLRERPEDIIELTHYFLHELSITYNRPIHGISQNVMQCLLHHDWPGNIRELKNVVERLVVFSEDGEIKKEDLPFDYETPAIPTSELSTYKGTESRSLTERLNEVEKKMIINELEKVEGNKLACAKNLHITRATLYNRLKKLGITN
ncbi:sigma-54 interaction domain-containing protein [Thalassobacillus devorans]|uniref:sigma-54 interaction domain-containing protein n=1 Tax=Thalassobacillus devorans TaxID=279813 RepID=UPI000A1CA02E|nr:sigma 54-interacting transcriptional regulator [Thalassobacillus devorans]